MPRRAPSAASLPPPAARVNRRGFVMALTAAGAIGPAFSPMRAFAQQGPRATLAPIDHAVLKLLTRNPVAHLEALRTLATYDDVDIAPSLILALRFSTNTDQEIRAALTRLTGDRTRRSWFDWMLWQEANPQIPARPAYAELKRSLFLRIDPNFEIFLRDPHLAPENMRIRFEEVTWGGVVKDGIPSLDKPEMIAAADATYLKDDDLVFGVSINGDVRAYPLRIMGWHEMFNDVIGGAPVALAYCTLCGAGILFDTQADGRDAPFVFGSSGFLYRSNKLMFDRETHSLWNQFTGEPVIGPLSDSGIQLRTRPVAIAPWGDWRAANPATTVLSLETGHRRDYGSGVVYRDYFASPDLMFPTATDERLLAAKDYVFGVRTRGAAKAWPLSAFAGDDVINDRVGDVALVLIGDADGRTVRAYDSGGRAFVRRNGALRADGVIWRETEDALIGADGSQAPRFPGHIAYWFAWNGYFGVESDLYEG